MSFIPQRVTPRRFWPRSRRKTKEPTNPFALPSKLLSDSDLAPAPVALAARSKQTDQERIFAARTHDDLNLHIGRDLEHSQAHRGDLLARLELEHEGVISARQAV